jgi:hypothetical protein
MDEVGMILCRRGQLRRCLRSRQLLSLAQWPNTTLPQYRSFPRHRNRLGTAQDIHLQKLHLRRARGIGMAVFMVLR